MARGRGAGDRRGLLLLFVALTAVPLARAESDLGDERAILDAWRALLDTPLAATRGHDLAWIAEPEGLSPDAALFFHAGIGIDRERLEYLGYHVPAELDFYRDVREKDPRMSRPHHVYRYGRFHVLSEADGREEQLAVFSVARALEALERRHADAFEEVMVGPGTAAEQLARARRNRPGARIPWINLTRHWAIVIGSADTIAHSRLGLGQGRPGGADAGGVAVHENTAVVVFDLAGIRGFRTRNLYRREDEIDNFLWYLRDGIVESLLHEGLHLAIARDNTVRDLFGLVAIDLRRAVGEDRAGGIEEALVRGATGAWFGEKGGLSRDVLEFYGALQEKDLGRLGREWAEEVAGAAERSGRPEDVGAAFRDLARSWDADRAREVFRLPILAPR